MISLVRRYQYDVERHNATCILLLVDLDDQCCASRISSLEPKGTKSILYRLWDVYCMGLWADTISG